MIGLWIPSVRLSVDATDLILRAALLDGPPHAFSDWADLLDYRDMVHGDGRVLTTLHIGERATPYRLWVDSTFLSEAIRKVLNDPKGTCTVGLLQRMLCHDLPDGQMADALIQVALFGKVIHG